MSRRWHWPKPGFWPLGLVFVFAAGVAGGWRGVLVMLAFLVGVHVIGNLLLP